MSAYVVGKDTIDAVVEAVRRYVSPRGGGHVGYLPQAFREIVEGEDGQVAKTAWDDLGRALWAMNRRAVSELYQNPEEPEETYVFRSVGCERIDLTDALACLVYQCFEGSVPELPLFKALEDFRARYCIIICHDLYATKLETIAAAEKRRAEAEAKRAEERLAEELAMEAPNADKSL